MTLNGFRATVGLRAVRHGPGCIQPWRPPLPFRRCGKTHVSRICIAAPPAIVRAVMPAGTAALQCRDLMQSMIKRYQDFPASPGSTGGAAIDPAGGPPLSGFRRPTSPRRRPPAAVASASAFGPRSRHGSFRAAGAGAAWTRSAGPGASRGCGRVTSGVPLRLTPPAAGVTARQIPASARGSHLDMSDLGGVSSSPVALESFRNPCVARFGGGKSRLQRKRPARRPAVDGNAARPISASSTRPPDSAPSAPDRARRRAWGCARRCP